MKAASSTSAEPLATATAPPPHTEARPPTRRGRLRIYLGATPGSGKTYAMLREGHDRRALGQDVVIGFVESHGRPRTEAAIAGLEVVPRRTKTYHGRTCEEMDVDAILARHPQVVLVDELAHTNLPGGRHGKRWQDVEELLNAGIDVITTVNVQAIEGVKDLAEKITGVPVRETVPDRIIDAAEEIQFIDISPEALQKRMRHGNIYAPEKVDIALANFFRPGNLAALREIALRLLAQNMGRATGSVQGTPEDVLVLISGRPSSEALIRRGARMARRFGGFCTVLRVAAPGTDVSPEICDLCQRVTEELQATWREVEARAPGPAVVAVARELGVEHVVVGEGGPSGLLGRFRKGLVDLLIEELPDVSVHIIAREGLPRRAHPPAGGALPTTAAGATSTPPRPAATLRVYVGYARGCGITTTMLEEARRRASRGTDVVVASVSTAGHAAAEKSLEGLEVLGGADSPARRGQLDVEALLARHPAVACVDELAMPATDGQPAAAWLGRILEAGISIVATLHLTDLASTRAALAGKLRPRPEGWPAITDDVLGMATEVELVDCTPSVLVERLRRGEIVPLDEVPAALEGDFRPELLAELRERLFRLIAGHTDRRLVAYMRERSIEVPWEARPRVMTCVPARAGMEWLVRRSAALGRAIDADIQVVTVSDRPRTEAETQTLAAYAALAHELGAEFVTIHERVVATALAAYARRSLVTELIVTRGGENGLRRSTLRELIRELAEVDIHVLSSAEG
jgi:two-component system sensor histidine kinase KdpD